MAGALWGNHAGQGLPTKLRIFSVHIAYQTNHIEYIDLVISIFRNVFTGSATVEVTQRVRGKKLSWHVQDSGPFSQTCQSFVSLVIVLFYK